MKKMLVLALALVTIKAHAAGPDIRDKAKELKDRAARERIERDARGNNHAVANERAKAVSDKIASSDLGRNMGGDLSHDLTSAINSDSLLLRAAEDVVASHTAKPELVQLNKARLEGIALIGEKIKGDARNIDKELASPEQKIEQDYVALVLSAGKQAANWPKTTATHMTHLLEIANNGIKSGKSVKESLEFAREEVKRLDKVDISIEDIRRLCKLV